MAKKEKYLCLAPEFQLIFSKVPSLWSFTSSVVYLLLSPCFDPPNQQILIYFEPHPANIHTKDLVAVGRNNPRGTFCEKQDPKHHPAVSKHECANIGVYF